MKKLSVSIIAKNEEQMIAKCLKSVSDADEIVVLDTGSSDKTPSICHQNRTRLYYYHWADDFAEARNKCLEYCKGDWILTIDCDEYLEAGGIKKIRDYIDLAKTKQTVVNLKIITQAETFYQPRLYRKDQLIYWKGKAYNYLSRPADGTLEVVINSGISPNHAKDPKRTLRILKDVLKNNPTDSRSTYFLGRELMRMQQPDAAIYWLEYHISLSPRNAMQADAYYRLAECYMELNREAKAVEALHHSVMVNENFLAAWDLLYRITKRQRFSDFSKLADNSNLLTIINKK